MLNVVTLSLAMLSVVMLNVVMLYVVMLNVVKLNVLMLSDVAAHSTHNLNIVGLNTTTVTHREKTAKTFPSLLKIENMTPVIS